ncbi:NAD-dependent epimerase/dehydratase family protein [Stutzerimonas urumqiensis]|uniref:NAD-dependent epimerase/dehydratase family protein n=1 Tax=Stutzerimonas urumqiensis TaxID=638269 RepID=UPI000EB2A51A|nr:NAD-dependent epimerase/dehydratase family protein [Stutzerimonas urumqiensis]
MKKKVLVTGGTGFVGAAVLARLLLRDDMQVLAWTRRTGASLPAGVIAVPGSSSRVFAAGAPVADLHTVVHCAGRVHVMRETASSPLEAFREANVDLTIRLARLAVGYGARRFVFLSTVKVHGESSRPGHPWSADDRVAPADPYACSKYEAEQALIELSEQTGLEVVIIRLPLVYGPGVKANFQTLMRWVSRGVPVPVGLVKNRRTMVALDNLVDLIELCIVHPEARNQVFMAGDGESLATPELLRRTASAMGCRAWLPPVPPAILEAAARASGQLGIFRRLCGSLEVDIDKTRQVLGWVPPVSVDQALRRTVEDFLRNQRK